MLNLKAQLIKLGNQNPRLRPHLKAILLGGSTGKVAASPYITRGRYYGQVFHLDQWVMDNPEVVDRDIEAKAAEQAGMGRVVLLSPEGGPRSDWTLTYNDVEGVFILGAPGGKERRFGGGINAAKAFISEWDNDPRHAEENTVWSVQIWEGDVLLEEARNYDPAETMKEALVRANLPPLSFNKWKNTWSAEAWGDHWDDEGMEYVIQIEGTKGETLDQQNLKRLDQVIKRFA